jgi:hypothetical protein
MLPVIHRQKKKKKNINQYISNKKKAIAGVSECASGCL